MEGLKKIRRETILETGKQLRGRALPSPQPAKTVEWGRGRPEEGVASVEPGLCLQDHPV